MLDRQMAAWRAQVELLAAEVDLDTTVPLHQSWGPDDFMILMLTRHWLEHGLALDGSPAIRAEVEEIDERYRALTVEDADNLLAGYLIQHEEYDLPWPPPWWFLRVPRSGPLVEELRASELGAPAELWTRAYMAIGSAPGGGVELTRELNSRRSHGSRWQTFTTRVDEGAELLGEVASTAPLQHHVDDLLFQLLDEPDAMTFDTSFDTTGLDSRFAVLVIVQDFDERHRAGVEFVLSPDWIALLATLGGSIDIDQYLSNESFDVGERSPVPEYVRNDYTRIAVALTVTSGDGSVEVIESGTPPEALDDDAFAALRLALSADPPKDVASAELLVHQTLELSERTETGLHLDGDLVAVLAGLGASIRVRHNFYEPSDD